MGLRRLSRKKDSKVTNFKAGVKRDDQITKKEKFKSKQSLHRALNRLNKK